MATLQDLFDALAEQNDVILEEIVQINEAIANAQGVPQFVVDTVKEHTEKIRDIVEDPLPPVDPVV